LQLCWLPLFTPVTWLAMLPGIHAVAAALQLELFRVSHLNILQAAALLAAFIHPGQKMNFCK
ncbi:hypothetical protein ACMV8I_19520, partial [Ewingella sp. S1.OA.A_B6]